MEMHKAVLEGDTVVVVALVRTKSMLDTPMAPIPCPQTLAPMVDTVSSLIMVVWVVADYWLVSPISLMMALLKLKVKANGFLL